MKKMLFVYFTFLLFIQCTQRVKITRGIDKREMPGIAFGDTFYYSDSKKLSGKLFGKMVTFGEFNISKFECQSYYKDTGNLNNENYSWQSEPIVTLIPNVKLNGIIDTFSAIFELSRFDGGIFKVRYKDSIYLIKCIPKAIIKNDSLCDSVFKNYWDNCHSSIY